MKKASALWCFLFMLSSKFEMGKCYMWSMMAMRDAQSSGCANFSPRPDASERPWILRKGFILTSYFGFIEPKELVGRAASSRDRLAALVKYSLVKFRFPLSKI